MQPQNNMQHPFDQYASCPDKVRIYMENSKDNQNRWMQESEKTIREFIQLLHQFKDFKEAYSFLANCRHKIAIDLKQRNEEGRTDYYGVFRKEEDHIRKIISASDGESFWKWQKDKIFELMHELIDEIEQQNNNAEKMGFIYDNHDFSCLKQKVSTENNEAIYYCVYVKFPYDKFKDNIFDILSKIEFFRFEGAQSNIIRIEYTPINTNRFEKYYEIANDFYQGMLTWTPNQDTKIFFDHAAKLAYLLAHLLLVKQGNVAITDWLLRGIAFRKGINLGYFNHSENISWDFKALLTPNRDQFIKWFHEKTFQYSLLTKEEMKQEFSFKK